MSINSNIDPRGVHFTLLAKGLQDVGQGRILTDKGRATIVTSMVMAAQSIHDDETLYRSFIIACQGLHADKREKPEQYADAWAFFRDNVLEVISDAKIKASAVSTDRVTSDGDEKLDPEQRARMNAPVSARSQALMFGASVVVQFDAASIAWSNVQIGKHNDVLLTDEENMKRLFANAKKDKSIRDWQLKDYPIGTFGNFRFSTLAEQGNEELRRRNVKKPATRKTADTAAMRDRLKLIAKDMDEADAKSYDALPDENVALAAFVGLANALNDGTLKYCRFTKDEYETILGIVEAAKKRAVSQTIAAGVATAPSTPITLRKVG